MGLYDVEGFTEKSDAPKDHVPSVINRWGETGEGGGGGSRRHVQFNLIHNSLVCFTQTKTEITRSVHAFSVTSGDEASLLEELACRSIWMFRAKLLSNFTAPLCPSILTSWMFAHHLYRPVGPIPSLRAVWSRGIEHRVIICTYSYGLVFGFQRGHTWEKKSNLKFFDRIKEKCVRLR